MSQPLPEKVHRDVVDVLFEGALEGAVDATRLPVQTLTPSQGLQVQLGILERWRAAGNTLGGWKVGLTAGPSRDSMGQGYRPFGYVLKERILPSGSTIHSDTGPIQQLEVELCIEMGERLQGRALLTSDVANAVRGARPAFELNQLRLPPLADPGITIADDLSHWGIVVGDLKPWPLTHMGHIVLQLGDRTIAEVVPGDVDIDPPLLAVKRLCHRLAEAGLGLEAGDVVITGALIKVPVTTMGTWRAEISGLGSVECTLR